MKKIVISGYYGFDNFGDEAILEILINALKKLDVDITVLSKNPEITAQVNEVNAFQMFNIADAIHQIFVSDILISGGGSLLQDKTSKMSFFYYIFIICVALMLKKPVIIFGQGVEPLNNKYLGGILAKVLQKVDYISVRDKKSANYLKKLGVKSKTFADAVWSSSPRKLKKTKKIVVQLREVKGFDEEQLNILAKALAGKFKDEKIEILSLQDKHDLEVCKKLAERLEIFDMKVKVLHNLSNKDVVKLIASANQVVAMRYHACLLAIKEDIPLLALSYDDKVKNLALEFKLPFVEIKSFYRGLVKRALDKIDDSCVDKELLNEKRKKSQDGIDDIIKFVDKIEVFE